MNSLAQPSTDKQSRKLRQLRTVPVAANWIKENPGCFVINLAKEHICHLANGWNKFSFSFYTYPSWGPPVSMFHCLRQPLMCHCRWRWGRGVWWGWRGRRGRGSHRGCNPQLINSSFPRLPSFTHAGCAFCPAGNREAQKEEKEEEKVSRLKNSFSHLCVYCCFMMITVSSHINALSQIREKWGWASFRDMIYIEWRLILKMTFDPNRGVCAVLNWAFMREDTVFTQTSWCSRV